MTEAEFNGAGNIYLRPGQWFAITPTGTDGPAASVTVVLNDDGTIGVAARHHRHGGTESTVTFNPDGKVVDE